MIEDHFGMYLVLIPHCMTEILLAKECKSGNLLLLPLLWLTLKVFTIRFI